MIVKKVDVRSGYMFKNAKKIRKMFEDDDPKLIFYLNTKKIDFHDVFKDGEDLIEKAIIQHKNTIAETAIMYCDHLNYLNKHNQSYLMLAILHNNLDIFLKLLEMDVELNQVDSERNSILFYAIKQDNKHYFNKLIEKEIDLKGFNNKGQNGVIYAYLHKRKEILFYLLKKNVFINHLDKDGNTVLHHAVLAGDLEFSLKLVDLGADVFIRNYQEQSCLDLAKERKLDELLINKVCEKIGSMFERKEDDLLLELLEDYHEVGDYTQFNIPFLIAYGAVKYNNKTIFDRIIRNINLLNCTDYRGKSLLMYCIEQGQLIMARKIIYLNVNLNLKDRNNKTVLFLILEELVNEGNSEAVIADYQTIFNELLECNMNVNDKDEEGNAVLHYAISTN